MSEMSDPKDLWSGVDGYLTDLLVRPDEALDSALRESDKAGLPAIAVSAPQGKMLHLLARAVGAKRILEIGTLGGYSTIWLARALAPGGKLISLEYEPKHAEVARRNLAKAGVADRVEIRVGRAQESLPQIAKENGGPFDLIFIDADKPGYVDYFPWAIKLGRIGTVIIADNVVRKGEVINPQSEDAMVQGIRRFHDVVANEKRVSATAIQTVGAKGYDGFTLAVVIASPHD